MITPSHIAIYRLAAGRAIAVTGFEAGWIALMVTVYATTHSTVWMSAALFVAIGTSGIATPIAGALGDRYDRRRVMIISELAAAACATAMAFTDRPGPLVALAALVGLAEAPFLPASNAAVPNLVADDRLEWANSTLAVGRNVGQMVGPLIGGLLTALIAPSAVFAVGAVGFLISAALVWSVSGRFHAEPAAQREEHGGELRAGFVFVWHSPVLARHHDRVDGAALPARPGAGRRAAAGARVRAGRGGIRRHRRLLGRRRDRWGRSSAG